MAALHVTTQNFDETVLKSGKTVLVDFWASWCGPCKMLAPLIEELSEELDDVLVCKVNVDEEPDLAGKYHIMSVPTLIVVKDGMTVQTAVGVQSKSAVLKMLGK